MNRSYFDYETDWDERDVSDLVAIFKVFTYDHDELANDKVVAAILTAALIVSERLRQLDVSLRLVVERL
jgi:hypothetical protein